MNKAVPWRIKGVPFDAREAAIEAARRSGMSLGEWLNSVIADQAAADGIDADHVDIDTKLDAVTRRLAHLRDRTAADAPPARPEQRNERAARRSHQRPRPAPRPQPAEEWTEEPDADHDDEPVVSRPAQHATWDAEREEAAPARPVRPTRVMPARPEIDAEGLLDNAIAAFERRANRSSERTARALAEVANLIDTTNRDREQGDATLATIAERLTDIERRVAKTPPPAIAAPAVDPAISETLARLEKRIEGLTPSTVKRDSDTSAQDALPRNEHTRPAQKRPLAAALADVARRQRELDGDREPERFPARPVQPNVFRVPEAAPTPLEARLNALVERLEKSAARRLDPAERTPDVSGLEGNITTLAERIERMRKEMNARPVPDRSSARTEDGIAAIRRELAAMSKNVADLAPRASVAAVETAVRDLYGRVAVSRLDGVGESALAPVEALTRELLGAIRSADPHSALEGLDRSIRCVLTKLEKFEGAVVADEELARGIADQMRDMHETLRRIQANQLPAERLHQGLTDLAGRVDSLPAGGADPVGRGELAQQIDEIRQLIAGSMSPDRSLQLLESRFDAIAERVDALFVERLDTMQRTFVAGMEEARARTPDVESLIKDLGARLDQAVSGGFRSMERAMARVAENTSAAPDDTAAHRLENTVRELAARIDANVAPGADVNALEAMHGQIARLTEQLDRSDKTTDTLVTLERTVADLFRRMEQSQSIAVDAAENAARLAAAQALRESRDASPEVTRELSDLRTLQDAADHRTHETLTAVHDTLAQLVNRLSSLEDELADVRTAVAEPTLALGREPSRTFRTERVADSRSRDNVVVDEDRHVEDVLIEPGTGFGRDGSLGAPDARIDPGSQSSFIQAARRAAQAASVPGSMPSDSARRAVGAERPKIGDAAAPLDQVRAYYASRKRPILLSLAALVMTVAAWQLGTRLNGDDRANAPASPPLAPAPARTSSAAPAEKSSIAAAPTVVAPTAGTDVAAPAAPAPTSATPPASNTLSASTPNTMAAGSAPPPSATFGGLGYDRTPVGSVNRTEAPVDTNGIVRSLAISGDAAAQYELAVRYSDGKLLARDLKLSAQWFEKAANQGLIPAQYRLGALYERGVGVNKDPAAAKQWYQKAADSGNARAMHNLAVILADGSAGKANYPEAMNWFRRAAELGVRDSQYNLAILYARGMGTPVDLVQSYLWFSAAANQGDEDAVRKRDDVAGRLSPTDLARAKAIAAAYAPKSPDPVANEVAAPPNGWESMKAAPRPDTKGAEPKSTTRPKLSGL